MDIKYKGKIIAVATQNVAVKNSNQTKTFEFALRSPGVRAIIVKDDKILLSKEYRYELADYDYRLPGGKVFDSLEEFLACNTNQLKAKAQQAIIKECFEEVGLKVKSPKLLHISKAGATVNWDLYYYEINSFTLDKQHLELGEDINFDWYTFDEVKNIILSNQFTEDRSVGVLLKYILQKETILKK